MSTFVSKSQYARHRGVTPAAVTYWCRDKRIVVVEGRVDQEASDAALDKTLNPIHGGNRVPEAEQIAANISGDSRASLIRSKSRQSDLAADLLDLELREKRGQLVELPRVNQAIADGLATILSQLRTISVRTSPRLVGETDLRRVQDVIDEEVDKICQETADTLRAMITGAEVSRQ